MVNHRAVFLMFSVFVKTVEFTLPTGKFLNAIYGVLLDDFWELFPYGPGLRHHGILPMRGLVA